MIVAKAQSLASGQRVQRAKDGGMTYALCDTACIKAISAFCFGWHGTVLHDSSAPRLVKLEMLEKAVGHAFSIINNLLN
ncbi:MAG TPA: hypothetical protein VIF60_10775 [Burkholderiaceae bacterium]|jgi:hypothetical protein